VRVWSKSALKSLLLPGIVLWAVAPFLLKLLEMADHMHGMFK